MLRVLVPLDGSENSLKSIEHLLARRDWYGGAPEVHLVHVQSALPGDVTRFITPEEVRRYHLEAGMRVLEPARDRLKDGGFAAPVLHVDVGDPSEAIAQYARDRNIDMIMLGTRGLGSVAGMLLGSVATKIVHKTSVPVLLLR